MLTTKQKRQRLCAVTTSLAGEQRGFDAFKKVKGRKRHILTDTLGLLLAEVVHSASVQDRDGARLMLQKASDRCLKVIFIDEAYVGALEYFVYSTYKWVLLIVRKISGMFN